MLFKYILWKLLGCRHHWHYNQRVSVPVNKCHEDGTTRKYRYFCCRCWRLRYTTFRMSIFDNNGEGLPEGLDVEKAKWHRETWDI